MAGILLCGTHGAQPPSGTSPRLDAALRLKTPIPEDWVSLVVVNSGNRSSWYLVDSERISAAGLDPAASPFFLRDGDRAKRLLHDRLMIVKIIPSDLKNPRVCKLCLAAAVVPLDAQRLRLPANLS